MISSDSVFCFIPAKAASTRLKLKNIRKLNGRELIYYSINAAKESALFDENIILSTESNEIKELAQKFGAKVPYLRVEHLAKDPYGVVDVVIDFLQNFPEYKSYQNICIILPTAPFVSPLDLRKAYERFLKGEYNSLFSVTETDHNALRSVYIQSNCIKPVFEKHFRKKSQELESTYRINGAITFVKTEKLLKEKSYFIEKIGAYIMDKMRSVDIDTLEDFEYAQYLIKRQNESTDTD